MGVIFAIDPGNVESGFVVCQHDGVEVMKPNQFGKVPNELLLNLARDHLNDDNISFVIEMVACYGMPVGREVFETCVWIGRLVQVIGEDRVHFVYRREEKMGICHSMKANDATIRQALVDRFAYGQPNHGKGTKREPGFFYGFHADVWQAFAVAVTYFDKSLRVVQK